MRSFWCLPFALIGATLAVPALGQSNPVGAEAPAAEPSPSHFELGVAALKAGDLSAAYEHLLIEYQASPSYKTAAVLGQAAGELGRYSQAASLIAHALRVMPSDVSAEVRTPIEDYLQRMLDHVMTVQLVVSPPEAASRAEVLLDGGWIAYEAEVFLEPGEHVLRVQAAGYSPVQVELHAQAGQRRQATFALVADAPREPPVETEPIARPEKNEPGDQSWRASTAWVTGALGLVSATIGGYYLYRAHDADGRIPDSQRKLERLGLAQPCAPDLEPPKTCEELGTLIDRRSREYNTAVVALSIAGVLAASSVALWVWELTDEQPITASLAGDGVAVSYQF